MILLNKELGLYGISVPKDAENIELHDENGTNSYITYHTGMGTEDFDILRLSVGIQCEYIGIATKDFLDFDTAPYLTQLVYPNQPIYYEYESQEDGNSATTNKNSAFYSLLSSSGVLWENLIKKPMIFRDSENSGSVEDLQEWQALQDKVIEKLVIIQKVK